MTNSRRATIEAGTAVYREWRRGAGAELDRWSKTYLTPRGAKLLYSGMTRSMSEDQARELVTRAVATGY